MKLEKFLQDNYNYNPDVKNAIKSYLQQWKSWYQGNVKSFHNYFVYNGKKKVPQKRFTMNMAKEISEDWSDILWSEKCKIAMKDENSQKAFDEISSKLDLNVVINQVIEKSGAIGTVATVVSVYDIKQNEDTMVLDVSEAKTRIDVVDVDWIFPLTWNNKEIIECAFGSIEYINGKKTIVLSVHKLDETGNYVIYNHLFEETNGNLKEIKGVEDTLNEFKTGSSVKWFSIFKPLLTNNLFSNSPFGIPHYANAIDNLKAVDISFDALKNEIKDGRRRIFARADMFSYDNGEQKLVFDAEDITVYQLPDGANKNDLIQSDNDDLRTEKQIETLNTNLNILGNKVGFGNEHYKYDGNNLQTATAVISANSKMFRRKKKLEVGYESAIYDLINAVCYVSTEFGNYSINNDGLVIVFDDSVLEDTESIANRAMREVSAGVLSKVEYRMKVFGETEEVANEKIEIIKANNPTIQDLIGE